MGKPVTKEQGADHVLSKFSKRERAEIDVRCSEAADAVELIAADGVDAAMNRFNGTSRLGGERSRQLCPPGGTAAH